MYCALLVCCLYSVYCALLVCCLYSVYWALLVCYLYNTYICCSCLTWMFSITHILQDCRFLDYLGVACVCEDKAAVFSQGETQFAVMYTCTVYTLHVYVSRIITQCHHTYFKGTAQASNLLTARALTPKGSLCLMFT